MPTVAEVAPLLRAEVAKAVAGQDAVVEACLVALLANGHVLLEGVPGVAKTLLVRSLSAALSLDYTRIQFTPDLMPSDVLGTRIYNPKSLDFELRRGPIFTSVLLADEINRTPPKTQSALLEAMEERRVTLDGEPHILPSPFIVFATQNPLDFEGTYPLPEAQQDRFLLKVLVDYPRETEEREVLKRHHEGFRPQALEAAGVQPVVDLGTLDALRAEVSAQTVDEKVVDYILNIVRSTRDLDELRAGASPRAGIALLNGSKALAALRGRTFVIPDDVKELAPAALRHRVILRPEAEVEGLTVDAVLKEIVDRVPVPR
jgi:MoxR-like ATPase